MFSHCVKRFHRKKGKKKKKKNSICLCIYAHTCVLAWNRIFPGPLSVPMQTRWGHLCSCWGFKYFGCIADKFITLRQEDKCVCLGQDNESVYFGRQTVRLILEGDPDQGFGTETRKLLLKIKWCQHQKWRPMCVGRRWAGLLRDITVCMTISGQHITLNTFSWAFFSPSNTLNLDYSHEPARWHTHTHTHTHTLNSSVSEELYHSVSLICRPVLGGIRSMESFKSDTAAETDRRGHLWRTLTGHFPSPQDHSHSVFDGAIE